MWAPFCPEPRPPPAVRFASSARAPPTTDPDKFRSSKAVLIAVPDTALEAVAQRLARVSFSWRKKVVSSHQRHDVEQGARAPSSSGRRGRLDAPLLRLSATGVVLRRSSVHRGRIFQGDKSSAQNRACLRGRIRAHQGAQEGPSLHCRDDLVRFLDRSARSRHSTDGGGRLHEATSTGRGQRNVAGRLEGL